MCMIGKPVKVRKVPRSRPIRAFRVWKQDGPRKPLRSWNFYVVWKDRELHYYSRGYRTKPRDFALPAHENYVGVWAYKTKWARDAHHPERSLRRGTVLLWGTVVEHEWGYRAAHAKVEQLEPKA